MLIFCFVTLKHHTLFWISQSTQEKIWWWRMGLHPHLPTSRKLPMNRLGDTSAYGSLPSVTALQKSQQLCWGGQGLCGGSSISRTAEEETGWCLLLAPRSWHRKHPFKLAESDLNHELEMPAQIPLGWKSGRQSGVRSSKWKAQQATLSQWQWQLCLLGLFGKGLGVKGSRGCALAPCSSPSNLLPPLSV